MAKLTLLALAFAALVAFATAHTTIITTVVEDDNPIPQMCRQKLQTQRLDKCQMYLQQGVQSPFDELNRGQSQQHGQVQGQQQLRQECCQQLQNVDRQCQCEAVKQVFEISRQQQGQFGSQHQLEQQLEQKAQNLPQQCGLQIRQDECQIIRRGRSSSSNSQQCSRVQGQQFNQCQRFIQQAQKSGSPRMMISRQSQQHSQQQQLQQCCNELENVQRECQCEAFEEVYRQAIQQQQGGQQRQQPWQQGGQQKRQQPWQQGSQRQVEQAMETIRNQCDIQVQQCQIPAAMF